MASPRILIGGYEGGMACRVSKPGKLATSTNLDDFLMHELLLLGTPLFTSSVGSVPSSGNGSLLIPHGLDFTPFVVIGGDASWLSIMVDSTKFTITSGSASTWSGTVTLTAYNYAVA